MSYHPFDRILTSGEPRPDEAARAAARPFQVKLDRRQALAAIVAASGAAFAATSRSLWADEALAGDDALPRYKGRGLYLVESRFRELWRAASRERANVLGPYVRGVAADEPEKVVPEGAPPPPPEGEGFPAAAPAGEATRRSGFLAWLNPEEAKEGGKEMVVSGVTPYLPSLKPVAPLDPALRKAALVKLAPNHWDRRPEATTFANVDQVAEELQASLAMIAGELQIDEREDALVLRRRGGEAFDDEALRTILSHPQVQSIEWDAVATTLALGEEAGELPPRATTEALGEEAGIPAPDATTFALGEEGSGGVTTYALGEEGVDYTTFALGEEGATTYALGEEGSGGVTTYALGEEGSGGVTTYRLGEEGAGQPTTLAMGEEGGGPPPTTRALGEEGGGVPNKPPVTTRALGEEGGGVPQKPPGFTRALGEDGSGTVRPIRPNPPRTTLALGEEGGGKRD